MKKIYLLIYVFFGIYAGLCAQNIGTELLNEAFTGLSTWSTNWKQQQLSGTIVWQIQSDTEEGNDMAGFTGYGNMEDRLITPLLYPNETNGVLQFKVKSGSYNFTGMELNVLLSTTYTNPEDFSVELLSLKSGSMTDTGITTGWVTHTIDLSDYEEVPVYLAFEAKGYTSSNFFIDDISGVTLAAFASDLQVQDLELPGDNPFVMENDEITVSALVRNLGEQAVTDQTISFLLDDVEVASTTLSLALGESAQVSQVITADAGSHVFSIAVPEDDYALNNQASGSCMFHPEDALLESFESGTFPPAYWTVEGDEKWYTTTYNAGHGDTCAYSYSSGYKLFTPKVSVLDGDSLCFDAYIYGSIEIATSTDGENWDVLKTITQEGIYTVDPFSIVFHSSEFPDIVGERYFSFEIVSQYGSINLDKVYGPTLVAVEDDVALQDFSMETASPFYAGNEITFQMKVKNKGLNPVTKSIGLYIDGSSITESISTGELAAGAESVITYDWTPAQGYSNAILSARVEADDYDGNNSASLPAMIYPSTGEDLPFYTDFEDLTSFPDFWSLEDTLSTTWAVLNSESYYSPNTTAYNGTGLMTFKAYSSNTTATLVSPNYTLDKDFYKVSFWLYRDASSYYLESADQINVYVNTLPEAGGTLLGSVSRSISLDPVVEAAGWYEYTFWADCKDLDEGFFVLEGVSTGTYMNIYVDELRIESGSAIALSLDSLNLPQVSWGQDSIVQDLTVILSNSGAETLSQAQLNWSVNGEEQSSFLWDGSLAYAEQTEIAFAPAMAFKTGQTYTIDLNLVVEEVSLATLTTTFEVKETYALPYTTSFEADDFESADWTILDMDGDGYTWTLSADNAQDGASAFQSQSYIDGVGGLSPDNWLITPAFMVPADSILVSFNAGTADAEYFAENYAVYIAENSLDTADFIPVYTEEIAENGFKNIALAIEGYQGKNIMLAFRHFACFEQNTLYLDHLTIDYPSYPVDFVLTLAGEPVENAEIAIDGLESMLYTDASGQAAVSLMNGTYTYTVTAANAASYTGSFTVLGSALRVDLALNALTFSVDFSVTMAGEPVDQAALTIVGVEDVLYTNEAGVAGIELAEGSYAFTIQADGALDYNGDFTVSGTDLDLAIELSLNNISQEGSSAMHTRIYPLPMQDKLHIESAYELQLVSLYTVAGKLVLQQKESTLWTNQLEQGVYLMVIEYANGAYSSHRLVKE